MSSSEAPAQGSVAWTDLTVADADRIRDFYNSVVGWDPVPVPMGAYHDYQMNTPGTGQPVAGVCHARGVNADLPPQWLIYITVMDMDTSLKRCESQGGTVVVRPRGMGAYGRFCVIRDPAGAVVALLEPPQTPSNAQAAGKTGNDIP